MFTLPAGTLSAGILIMDHSVFNPDEQQRDTTGKIVAGLERVSEVFKVLLWEQATAVGLSPIQIQILLFVEYHTPDLCNVSHLAKEFNITKATVSDAIRALEQKKLIFKKPSAEDRRSYTIHLEMAAKKIISRIGQFALPLRQQVDNLTESDKEDLWSTLSKLIYGLNRTGILTVQRTCYGCTFYVKGYGGPDYCKLLEKELFTNDIRLDCPEYEERIDE